MPVEVLNEAEAMKMLAWASSQKRSKKNQYLCKRNTLMFLLMLDAGLRVGEVVRLRWSSLCTAEQINTSVLIDRSTTKTKKTRSVPMAQRLLCSVANWVGINWDDTERQSSNFVFKGSDPNQHFSTRQLNRIVNRAGISALNRPVHPHILRHTFATNLMRHVSIRVVQDLMGHSSITSTQIYTHPNANDLKEAIVLMSESVKKF